MSGTSAVTAVIYEGTAQSLNSLAHERLAPEFLLLFCVSVCHKLFKRWLEASKHGRKLFQGFKCSTFLKIDPN